jgi:hypothetical protein
MITWNFLIFFDIAFLVKSFSLVLDFNQKEINKKRSKINSFVPIDME